MFQVGVHSAISLLLACLCYYILHPSQANSLLFISEPRAIIIPYLLRGFFSPFLEEHPFQAGFLSSPNSKFIMSFIRRMTPQDLLSLNLTNLDPLTENYDPGFYLNYLMRWPSLFSVVEDRDAGIVGYSA
jgi:hypothetical protein